MILIIDAGNTNVNFALYDQKGTCHYVWRFGYNSNCTADEYFSWISSLLTFYNISIEQFKACVISCVVPNGLLNLVKLSQQYFNLDPMVIGEKGVNIGVEPDVEYPEEVGADRLVNSIAAFTKVKQASIVIDFGTATNFDVINDQGSFCGGIICPGVNLSLQALYQAAEKLPHMTVRPSEKIIGRNTISCMQSGIFWGYVAMCEGLIAKIKKEMGKDVVVIATGGLAVLFYEHADFIDMLEPMLTFDGIFEVYKKNL